MLQRLGKPRSHAEPNDIDTRGLATAQALDGYGQELAPTTQHVERIRRVRVVNSAHIPGVVAPDAEQRCRLEVSVADDFKEPAIGWVVPSHHVSDHVLVQRQDTIMNLSSEVLTELRSRS